MNELLYTHSSIENTDGAVALFRDEKQVADYHEGYRQQTLKWPRNPLDIIVYEIIKKGAYFSEKLKG